MHQRDAIVTERHIRAVTFRQRRAFWIIGLILLAVLVMAYVGVTTVVS